VVSWHVAGLALDHTQSIQTSVKDFIHNNWTLTGNLSAIRIFFGLGWYDRNRPYQIHFRHDSPGLVSPYTIGVNGLQKYDDVINIHFWVSKSKTNVEPPELDQMYNETVRIISSNRTGLESSQGICAMFFLRPPFTLPQPDSEISVWHGVGTLAVRYFKVYS
jgi:hypothetical protein